MVVHVARELQGNQVLRNTSRLVAAAGCGKDCGSEASRSECLATEFYSSSHPPIGSWESLVDVVAGSSPVGGTRSYCIPNRAGESQFPSVSPPEPTIGLSPRVRGNHRHVASMGAHRGSIPACAGEPSTSRGRTARSTVYPRVCGGTCFHDDATSTRNGLSPRVRGNPRFLSQGARQRRSIPACAGEPHKVTGDIVLSGVYPRVCGGTSTTERIRTETVGLSPRVRGNPTEGYRAGFSLRSIPACAGGPCGQGGPAVL